MENSPFNGLGLGPAAESGPKPPESDKKDKDKKDSRKKALGSILVEQPAVEKEQPEAKKSLFEGMFDKPETETETSPQDAPEQEAETTELSSEDSQYAVEQIATERRAEVAEEPVDMTPEEVAAHEAAQEFYDRIVDEGLDLETAATETLAEVGPEDDDAEEDEATAPVAAAGGSSHTPPPTGPNGGPTLPPNPNVPPVAPVPVTVAAANSAPIPVTHNVYIPYYDRSRAFGDVLVGGIVGYLIGRRRGRIKTEKKLLPVQKKLEREVTHLKQDLATKEGLIREAARARVRQVASPASQRRERPLPAPELHRKPQLAPRQERIGKVLVAAETIREVRQEEAPRISLDNAEKQVETLTRNELLTLSEKVIVEGSTLRNVYETHLISERGLRRLVTEYLRGGDVVRAFRRELIEREIDFERDPKLRDTVRKNLSGGARSQSLQKLLQQAGVAPIDETPAQIAQARAQQLADAKRQSKQASNRKVIDVSLITIIAVLLAVVLIMAAHRM